MAIDLVTKFLPYVDELFATESKHSQFTNQDFDFTGAATVKVYKVGTVEMNDYGRRGAAQGTWSRYGEIVDLNATTEEFTLSKDRSFTFVIDKLDEDETLQQVAAASALARQLREVVIPEVDTHVLNEMLANAENTVRIPLGTKNLYAAIIEGTKVLDLAEVPEKGRVLIVTPDTYMLLKEAEGIALETNIGQEMRLAGGIGVLDGMNVIRVPAARLPEGFGFMIAHPCATVAPQKLAAYKIHVDPPGISGSLVEGRIVYDAFCPDNKKSALYVHMNVEVSADDSTGDETTE